MEDGRRDERHAADIGAANAFEATEKDIARRPHFRRETLPALSSEMPDLEDEPH